MRLRVPNFQESLTPTTSFSSHGHWMNSWNGWDDHIPNLSNLVTTRYIHHKKTQTLKIVIKWPMTVYRHRTRHVHMRSHELSPVKSYDVVSCPVLYQYSSDKVPKTLMYRLGCHPNTMSLHIREIRHMKFRVNTWNTRQSTKNNVCGVDSDSMCSQDILFLILPVPHFIRPPFCFTYSLVSPTCVQVVSSSFPLGQGMISTLICWFDYQNQDFQDCFLTCHWFVIIKVGKQ